MKQRPDRSVRMNVRVSAGMLAAIEGLARRLRVSKVSVVTTLLNAGLDAWRARRR